jgi:hypothetical protein
VHWVFDLVFWRFLSFRNGWAVLWKWAAGHWRR